MRIAPLRIVPVLAAVAALAACASAPSAGSSAGSPAPSPGLSGGCDADRARSLVGQAATDASLEQARAAAGAATVRRLEPGQAVTMEYRGDRLNVVVDATGTVAELRCG